jgi:hypothetical protein
MKEMKKLRRKSLRKMIKRKSVSLTRGLVPEYECFNVLLQRMGLLSYGHSSGAGSAEAWRRFLEMPGSGHRPGPRQ